MKRTEIDNERIRFETNQADIWEGPVFERNATGAYVSVAMQERWAGWLACAESRASIGQHAHL